MILNMNTLDMSKVTEMPSALDLILESDEYAEWVQNNALEYGFTVCNGDTLIEAMESDEMALAYLRHINYGGE